MNFNEIFRSLTQPRISLILKVHNTMLETWSVTLIEMILHSERFAD
jgi:hypothetical protein